MSDTESLERIASILTEVRDNQKAQLERQAESLALQKEQFQLYLEQHAKTARIQDRAEAVQERGAQLVDNVRRFVPVLLFIVVILIAYVSWLIFRISR